MNKSRLATWYIPERQLFHEYIPHHPGRIPGISGGHHHLIHDPYLLIISRFFYHGLSIIVTSFFLKTFNSTGLHPAILTNCDAEVVYKNAGVNAWIERGMDVLFVMLFIYECSFFDTTLDFTGILLFLMSVIYINVVMVYGHIWMSMMAYWRRNAGWRSRVNMRQLCIVFVRVLFFCTWWLHGDCGGAGILIRMFL